MAAFTECDIKRLEEQVKRSEGLRLCAYRCTSGALTVGYGHNCDASPVSGICNVGDRIDLATAEALFAQDLAASVWQVRDALPWVTGIDTVRQAVLYDMAFNMGLGTWGKRGLLSFCNTLKLVEGGAYEEAARNMLVSKWAKQVKGRAKRLAEQMKTGEWQ